MKLLPKNHEANFIIEHINEYDNKRYQDIPVTAVKTVSFGSRAERKAFLQGMAIGLEHSKARLLTLNEVDLICDMSELADLQDEIAGIEGAV